MMLRVHRKDAKYAENEGFFLPVRGPGKKKALLPFRQIG